MVCHGEESRTHLSALAIFLIFTFTCLTPLFVAAQSLSERRIPVTFDPSDRRLTTYEEYLEKFWTPAPFYMREIYETARPNKKSPGRGTQKVLVIVNSSIQDSIQAALNQYMTDMEVRIYGQSVGHLGRHS